jgi:hypothetical protein
MNADALPGYLNLDERWRDFARCRDASVDLSSVATPSPALAYCAQCRVRR